MTYDNVNPDHYKGDRQFEPIAVIEDWNLNYRLGNALKYLSRNGRKPGEDPREGLKKAIWYIEREIASLDAPSGSYVPDEEGVYDEILTYYGQSVDLDEAWPVPFDSSEDVPVFHLTGFEPVRTETSTFLEGTANRVTEAQASDWADFWDSDEDYMWDPSLGPIELSDEEVHEVLKRKDLEQFSEDEIVSTIEKRGFVLGVKKDGSTCVLKDGRCEK